ncbi:putative ACR, YggU family [Candidatus Gugararchaeum adminiculabundum]|nr:putative ACR, YggU family [Candidatus Gugararchaeum adminiculabundum]
MKVVPNSRRFSVQSESGVIRIKLRSAPEKGEANRELVRELSGLLDCSVEIVRGHASKTKELELGLGDDELKRKLLELNKQKK